MKKHLLLHLILVISISSFAQKTISGTIVDAENKQPLPFSTIGLQGSSIGTVTNTDGEFHLNIPIGLDDEIIVVNFLGYESRRFPISGIKGSLFIELTPSVLQLDELVIRPLSPTDYIKLAVKKIGQNYPTDPFQTQAYYREKFVENGEYVNMVEGVFNSYYPSYQDTLENQHQLLLYRQPADLSNIDFMSDFVDKQNRKGKKKAEKKGEDFTKEDPTAEIQKGFGGPDNILSMDLIKDLENCLDSTLFKKFKYSFANGVKYQERELLVIHFESKGKTEHMRQEGEIYIDVISDGIVAVEYSGEFVVPALIRPVLFALGIGLKNPIFSKKVRYQLHEGRWYPDNFQWFVDFDIKKRHMFSSNEKSKFYIEQLFKINRIAILDIEEIKEESRFDADEPMDEQIFNENNLRWDQVNTLKTEFLEAAQNN